ncbi:hypothetical protein J2I47_18890 [Fibrella sp. HMF5335]|uniref:Uncharacterized protein n=1 Tax=Fibrella rubiginis TaxID=2817060 RepID=A0A939GHX2_9BACT|nr:hypothetical protein [Fibrella rubiginis]MBO0938626.1 hypothetical protein [Fibrella rubiginis]
MTHYQLYRLAICLLRWLVVLPGPVTGYAQGAFSIGSVTTRHQLGVSAGLEPELTTSVGYAYQVIETTNSLQIRLGAVLTVPPYRVSTGSGRLSGLVALDWHPTGPQSASRWGGRLALMPYYARNCNEAGTLDGLGLELRLLPLHRGKHRTGGLDLGWQGTLLTYIHHSDLAKAAFNERYVGTTGPDLAGPKDGWYRNTAHRFRLGYTSAWRLGSNAYWQLSVGTLVALQRQGVLLSFAHGQVPVYLETAFSLGW